MKPFRTLALVLLSILLVGCVQTNEPSENGTASDQERNLYIFPLGATDILSYDEHAAHGYSVGIDNENVVTRFNRDSEEESFEHEADLMDFTVEGDVFSFTYINHQDEEIIKSFEILSDSVVKDIDNQIRYQWEQPEWLNEFKE